MSRISFIWIVAFLCVTNAGTAKSWAQGTNNNTSSDAPGHPVPDPEAMKRADEVSHQALVFTNQARALLKAGKLREAEQACRKSMAIEEEFHSFPGFLGNELLGEIYLQGGQNEKALECFRLASPNGPDDRRKLDIALAYCHMGDYEQVLRFYTDGIMGTYSYGGKLLDPTNFPDTDNLTDLHARVLLARGVAAWVESDPEEAVADFQAADKLLPKNPAVQFFWGEALKRLERYAEAIPHYDIAAARGSGVIGKEAKEGVRRSRIAIETRKAWEEQQAKKAKQTPQSAAQASGKTGP